jgi:hypothetical protein
MASTTRAFTTTGCCWAYLPRNLGVFHVINAAAHALFPSLMIFYLPLAGNVGNEGAGAFPSSALAGHARGYAAHPRRPRRHRVEDASSM